MKEKYTSWVFAIVRQTENDWNVPFGLRIRLDLQTTKTYWKVRKKSCKLASLLEKKITQKRKDGWNGVANRISPLNGETGAQIW